MRIADLIDEQWEQVIDGMDRSAAGRARGLAHALRLAPADDVPWSAVFGQQVTLGAPALLAEAMPEVAPRLVAHAVRAHMLAVIGAFALDRIADDQIARSPDLEALLADLHRARDEALALVSADDMYAYEAAAACVERATVVERHALKERSPVDLATYQAISLEKQRPGLVAANALTHAAGWGRARRSAAHAMLEDVALGLQMLDDAVDWPQDLGAGGAWAVCLAAGQAVPHAVDASGRQDAAVRSVLESGVLGAMLSRGEGCFHRAGKRAEVIGAAQLAAWAADLRAHVADLARQEVESPGYAARRRALGAWAAEIVA